MGGAGIMPKSSRHSTPTIPPGGGGAGTGVPVYSGDPSQTLIYAGDAGAGFYADLTAAGAGPLGSSMRLVPATSPALGGGAVPTNHFALVTGKDGSGKAIQNIFPVSGGQPGDKWWLTNAPSIDISKTIYTRVWAKFDGATPTEPKVTKFHQQGMRDYGGGSVPQFTIVDGRAPYTGAYNPFSGPEGPSRSIWRVDDNFSDVVSAFPDGNDQGLQAVGPFPTDNWGTWREFIFAFRPRVTGDSSSAIRDLWIDGVLVLSVKLDSVGVVPDGSVESGNGAGKQFCGIDMVTEGTVDSPADTTLFQTFGGLSFAAVSSGQAWTLDWNIGDGNPLHADTMVVWTE